jgi:hypothetical protein
MGSRRLALGPIHIGVGGGVNDYVRVRSPDQRPRRVGLGNIQLSRATGDDLQCLRSSTPELATKLPPCPGDQDLGTALLHHG